MNEYWIQVLADRFPTDYRVQASNWHTAAARGIKMWRKRFAREVVGELHIKIVRGQKVHKNN